MMSSFKHHFGVLRDHLLTLLAQQEKDDDVIDRATNQLGDAVLAQLEQPDTLSDVFESINQCLVWIQPTASGRSKGRGSDEEEESESDSDEENVQFKVFLCNFSKPYFWRIPKIVIILLFTDSKIN
ncbi:MAG: hypothetical protein MJE68_12585 [Proteobacteria bacterium]|nr:hypothetical protein [Pseudomonadota bacterium]